ncbi:hypothetical protein INT45_012417 [Circinella minor]|uniref:PHD-type domain-containing protein n=1 Tax=Circinella minor TaxID=1195481 RepID=A0A8H7S4F7_9FUNG|nr:hypothetical protein INT45_012417 [Circinella minor]
MATRRATRSASPNRPPSSASPNFPDDGNTTTTATYTTHGSTSNTTGTSTTEKRKLPNNETDTSKRPLKRRNNKDTHATTDEVTPIKNNDYCSSCGFVGRFLCCDACPKAFHFTCVDPPMDDSDVEHLEGEWYCRECEHNRQTQSYVPTPPPFPPVTALFHRMLQDLDSRNPMAYRPPIEIINYFEGVSMDKVGQYVDSSTIKPIRHKCRKSALHGRMITCDYCPLSWHMDCIDPPMASMPNPARKWMCPTHVEHVLPRMRRKRQSTTMDPVPPGGGSDAETDDDDYDDNDVEENNVSKAKKDKSKESSSLSLSTDPMMIEGNPMIKYNQTVYRLPYESFKLRFPSIEKLLSHVSLSSSSSCSTSSSLSFDQNMYEENDNLNASKEDVQICSEGIAEIQSGLAKFISQENIMEIPEEERSIAMLARAARMLDSGESDDEEQQSPAEHSEVEEELRHHHHESIYTMGGGKNDYIAINKQQ